MTARCIMVLGTTSGAGKSWLATALCRYYARQGLKVAPFKAQNMSNNARVARCAGGVGEMGSAQYFQALAAKAEPDVRMNPVLLKPERDTHSQVVLMGQVNQALSNLPWRDRSAQVWPVIAQALDELRGENDVLVIEGAGSPAEINLSSSDIVNMRVALHCQAACLLVTDIDRGGSFAHLYGTWALLPAPERGLIKGFVLNKFRGDAALLAPAPQMLQDLTTIPTVATLPMWRNHGLPEEDGMLDWRRAAGRTPGVKTVAIITYPRISNLDEFQPLASVPGIRLVWVHSSAQLAGLEPADWIILPGSKHTSGDLAWLRAQALDAPICQHARQGGAVLGICGGLQMLGEALIDPHAVEAIALGNAPGLGILPLVTVFAEAKTVRHTRARFLPVCVQADTTLCQPWLALQGIDVQGYEIRHGQTQQHQGLANAGDLAQPALPLALGWLNDRGNVLGVYLHGLFENPAVMAALFGVQTASLDTVFEGLADFITRHFDDGVLDSLIR